MSDSINSNNKANYDKYEMAGPAQFPKGRTETPCNYPRSDAERNGDLKAMARSLSESHDGEGMNSDTLYY